MALYAPHWPARSVEPAGQLTTSFLSICARVKDNRLLPRGFAKQTAPDDVAVRGGATNDGWLWLAYAVLACGVLVASLALSGASQTNLVPLVSEVVMMIWKRLVPTTTPAGMRRM